MFTIPSRSTTLQLRLLKVNAELKIKSVYAGRLEALLRMRTEKIDELTAQVDQLRMQNRRLDEEAEHLAAMVARPQLITAE